MKKILVVHGDARVRRHLVLLFADAGFDVRAFAAAEAAAENARGEWYDLAVIDHELSGAPGFVFVDTLKKIQPTVPVLLLVSRLELPLVVQGIRLGVADVLAVHEEPRVMLRRVRTLLRLESAGEPEAVTAEDLAQVESMLEDIGGAGHSSHPFGAHTHEPGADLLRVSKEKAVLEARVERLQHEKDALGAELKTLLGQNADAARLQAELAELRTERELAAATQAAIDEKARALSETRAAIATERSQLEEERRKREQAAPGPAVPPETAAGRAEINAWRQRLAAEEDRLAEETTRFREESTRFAQERRRWHEDLDLFRAQEENLRAYEERLRKIQSDLEADRVLWCSASTRPASPSPFTDDAALREAWGKLQRATELLEAERANFKDDRLAMQDHHRAVKRREEQVRDREIQLAMREKKLNELPPPPAPAAPAGIRNFTRAPMDMARAVFGARKE